MCFPCPAQAFFPAKTFCGAREGYVFKLVSCAASPNSLELPLTASRFYSLNSLHLASSHCILVLVTACLTMALTTVCHGGRHLVHQYW